MSQPILPNTEALLQQLGTKTPVVSDLRHRHQLRRALLHSVYFDVHRKKAEWSRWIMMTTGMFAGSMLILVIAVLPDQPPQSRTSVRSLSVRSQAVTSTQEHFVDKKRSTIRFTEFSPVLVREDLKKVFEPTMQFASLAR